MSSLNITHEFQNGNGNLPKIENSSKFLISVHKVEEDAKKANINTYEGKPDSDTVGTFQNDYQYKAVAYTHQQFIDHVLNGKAFYPSNKKADTFESDVIVFDIDDEKGQGEYPVSSLLKNHFFLCYPSPSFVEGKNCKHRVIIPLSRAISSTEKLFDDLDINEKLFDTYGETIENSLYKSIVRHLSSDFPEYEVTEKGIVNRKERYDRASERMRQFYFGCRERFRDKAIINFEADVIDVDLMAEGLKALFKRTDKAALPKIISTTQHSVESKDKHPGQSGFFARVDAFVRDNIWLAKCCENVDEFFPLYPHNFQDWKKDGDKVIAYKGSNFGGNGTGAWVYMNDGYDLPLYMNTREGVGNKWTRYALDGGKYRGDLPQDLTLKGKDFDVVAKYFIETVHGLTYDRNDFLIHRTDEEKDALKDELVKRCFNYFNSAKTQYIKRTKWDANAFLYYGVVQSDTSGCWSVTSNKNVICRELLIPLISQNIIEPFYEEHEIFFCEPRKFFVSCLKSEIFESLELDDDYEIVRDLITFRLQRNCEVVPLADGQYNWLTREFTPTFDSTINNTNRYPHPYKTWSSDKPLQGQIAFEKWLEAMYTPDIQTLIKNYLVLSVHGMASKTTRMLNFYGEPNTGKSTVLNIVRMMLSDMARNVNGKNLLNSENRFAYQALGGKHTVLIDEFRADVDGWERIKHLSGNSESLIIEIEKKGEIPYEDLIIGGVISCSQNAFYIPKSDDGGVRRRITPIYHPPEKKSPAIKALALEVLKPENIYDIFIWAIHQNGYDALIQFSEIANNSDEFKESVKTVVVENDPVLQFMGDRIEFTNDVKDRVTPYQLRGAYELWLSDMGEYVSEKKREFINRIPEFIVDKAIVDNGFNWTTKPKNKKGGDTMKIDGKPVRCFAGIVIKTEEEVKQDF
ncbi:MAG: hypothetical protein KME57_36250 [Scytonema hyalinum WJT4-NPBG1]|jgi:hypothetical protein|nr:hypothetical protein [Scytonema hyalinum WJT4-NPBG1]